MVVFMTQIRTFLIVFAPLPLIAQFFCEKIPSVNEYWYSKHVINDSRLQRFDLWEKEFIHTVQNRDAVVDELSICHSHYENKMQPATFSPQPVSSEGESMSRELCLLLCKQSNKW